MIALLSFLLRLPVDPPASPLPADGLAGVDDAVRVCGWFNSSWELQQGLAVSELPASELPVAALWFDGVDLGPVDTLWLQ